MITRFSWENAYNWDTNEYNGPLCCGSCHIRKHKKYLGSFFISVIFPNDQYSKNVYPKFYIDGNDKYIFLFEPFSSNQNIKIEKLLKDIIKEIKYRFKLEHFFIYLFDGEDNKTVYEI